MAQELKISTMAGIMSLHHNYSIWGQSFANLNQELFLYTGKRARSFPVWQNTDPGDHAFDHKLPLHSDRLSNMNTISHYSGIAVSLRFDNTHTSMQVSRSLNKDTKGNKKVSHLHTEWTIFVVTSLSTQKKNQESKKKNNNVPTMV